MFELWVRPPRTESILDDQPKDGTGQRVSPVIPSVHTYPALLGSPDLSQMDGSLLGFLFFSFFLSLSGLVLFPFQSLTLHGSKRLLKMLTEEESKISEISSKT